MCVTRPLFSMPTRYFSILARAGLSLSLNWIPMPCARLAWALAGVIHTTVPRKWNALGFIHQVQQHKYFIPQFILFARGDEQAAILQKGHVG